MTAVDHDALRGAMKGPVLAPGDDGWHAACLAWNLAADRSPALVAQPTSAGDVVAIVDFARAQGLRVAPQTTGHCAGALAPLAEAILVTTGGMQSVKVDPGRASARVEAGTLWGAVSAAADQHALFPLSGSSTTVGVVGYSLAGGLSFLGRAHGLAANHVTAVDLVTPDGQARRVTAGGDPDLFWALRGGSANFGVVTALEFDLFRYDHVVAGMFTWPAELGLDVLRAWVAWSHTAPDAVTTSFRILHLPPAPALPPFLSGRSLAVVDGVFAGGEDEAAGVLAPLRALGPETDTWAPTSPAGLDGLHLDPPDPTAGVNTTMLLGDLDEGAMARFVAAIPAGGRLMFGELRHIGGALASPPDGGGATSYLPGRYSMSAVAIGTAGDPGIPPALAAVDDAVADHATGRVLPTFAERPTDPGALWPPDTVARLAELRSRYDPDRLMLPAHPV